MLFVHLFCNSISDTSVTEMLLGETHKVFCGQNKFEKHRIKLKI